MTTANKAPIALITASTGNLAAGSTKSAPGIISPWINTQGGTANASDGADIGYSITNSASAPGVLPNITIQWSPDNGTTIYDYQTVGGDTVASSVNSNTIWIDPPLQYVRVIAYGNTTNPVTVSVTLSGVTRA